MTKKTNTLKKLIDPDNNIVGSHTGDREERCYMTGRLDGTAKYYYSSGAVETRIYENGVLQVRYN